MRASMRKDEAGVGEFFDERREMPEMIRRLQDEALIAPALGDDIELLPERAVDGRHIPGERFDAVIVLFIAIDERGAEEIVLHQEELFLGPFELDDMGDLDIGSDEGSGIRSEEHTSELQSR